MPPFVYSLHTTISKTPFIFSVPKTNNKQIYLPLLYGKCWQVLPLKHTHCKYGTAARETHSARTGKLWETASIIKVLLGDLYSTGYFLKCLRWLPEKWSHLQGAGLMLQGSTGGAWLHFQVSEDNCVFSWLLGQAMCMQACEYCTCACFAEDHPVLSRW